MYLPSTLHPFSFVPICNLKGSQICKGHRSRSRAHPYSAPTPSSPRGQCICSDPQAVSMLICPPGAKNMGQSPRGSPLTASSWPHDLLLGPSQFQGRRSLARGAPGDGLRAFGQAAKGEQRAQAARDRTCTSAAPPQLHSSLVSPGCHGCPAGLPPSLAFLLCPSSRPQTPPLT